MSNIGHNLHIVFAIFPKISQNISLKIVHLGYHHITWNTKLRIINTLRAGTFCIDFASLISQIRCTTTEFSWKLLCNARVRCTISSAVFHYRSAWIRYFSVVLHLHATAACRLRVFVLMLVLLNGINWIDLVHWQAILCSGNPSAVASIPLSPAYSKMGAIHEQLLFSTFKYTGDKTCYSGSLICFEVNLYNRIDAVLCRYTGKIVQLCYARFNGNLPKP